VNGTVESQGVRGASHFASLGTVITSAVAVVSATFGLFNSVLGDLMPQVEGATQTASFVSFGTVIVLLALSLLIRKRLRVAAQVTWAIAGMALLACAAFVYLGFSDLVRQRVYYFPPMSGSVNEQRPHVSGPYHDKGRVRAEGMDVATAVSAHGGPHIVNGNQLLWTQEARSAVVGTFVRYYMAIAFLMTTALYVAGIAVWRALAAERGSRRRDKAV
jgi:hypothetical protein